MLVEALFESDEQLFEFLTETLGKTPGVLQSETYHVLQTVKINYDWKLPLDHHGSIGPGRSGSGGAGRATASGHRGQRIRRRGNDDEPVQRSVRARALRGDPPTDPRGVHAAAAWLLAPRVPRSRG
jgi:hypothetical protein